MGPKSGTGGALGDVQIEQLAGFAADNLVLKRVKEPCPVAWIIWP